MGLEDFLGFDRAVEHRLDKVVDELAREFDGVYDRERVRSVVGESARQLSGGTVAAFIPILAERFARERLRAQAQGEGRLEKTAYELLFVSLTGGGRAQIGAALLASRAGESVSVHSAGSRTVGEIDANVRAVMEEVGIDLSDAFTKPLTREVMSSADLVVTMGRSVGDVEIPSTTRHLDWRVGDPAGAPLNEVRRVRDDIERRVDLLATRLAAGTQAVAGLSAHRD
jgi:protein-tyrosine-phosphatase